MFAIIFALSGAARGQLGSHKQDAPRFTIAEQIIIARNEALNELLESNPWAIRTIMDVLVAGKQRASPRASTEKRQRDAGSIRLDPQRNPDLEAFQRSSPEAAYDLFQLLKRAAGSQTGPK